MHASSTTRGIGALVPAACVLAAVGLFVVVSFVAVLLSGNAGDILRAYPSPERHDGIRELAVTASLPASVLAGDFDGDGTEDTLSIEYFHMEPLFQRTTSGMVEVRSGGTGEILLAHAVDTPLSRATWCGDIDGNGTEEVLIQDDGRRFALGFQNVR